MTASETIDDEETGRLKRSGLKKQNENAFFFFFASLAPVSATLAIDVHMLPMHCQHRTLCRAHSSRYPPSLETDAHTHTHIHRTDDKNWVECGETVVAF